MQLGLHHFVWRGSAFHRSLIKYRINFVQKFNWFFRKEKKNMCTGIFVYVCMYVCVYIFYCVVNVLKGRLDSIMPTRPFLPDVEYRRLIIAISHYKRGNRIELIYFIFVY